MGPLVLICRLLLAGVFGVAGATKLADLPGSRESVRSFGTRERLVGPIGFALPALEVVVAGLLLWPGTVRWGAIVALVLLVVFAGAIAVTLARGRRPDCHCFGRLHSARVGLGTLARDLALTAPAGFLVAVAGLYPSSGALDWVRALSTAEIVGLAAGCVVAVLMTFQGWFSLQLLRQNGRLLARLDAIESLLGASGPELRPAALLANGAAVETENGGVGKQMPRQGPGQLGSLGVAVGALAPAFALPRLHGGIRSLDELRAAGRPVLLVFSDPACGPCNALLPEVARWQRDHGKHLTVAIISRGTTEENAKKTSAHGLGDVLLQQDREVAELYRAHATPSAVLVSVHGLIATPLARGADEIRRVLEHTLSAPVIVHEDAAHGRNGGRGPTPPGGPLGLGESAPDFQLQDLNRRLVHLAGLRGEPFLLLFWNPACGFCLRMLDELKSLEEHRPPGAPRLLVVSRGSVEENRAMGLTSTVVLDDHFDIARRFGARGTPSALVLDGKGRIASSLLVGAPAILAAAQNAAQPMLSGGPA